MHLIILLTLSTYYCMAIAMENPRIEDKKRNSPEIFSESSSDDIEAWRHLQERQKKFQNDKKKYKRLVYRLNTTRTICYVCCGAMLALSFQCETNSHSTVKGMHFNETNAINPPAPHPQGGFMIEDLSKFVVGVAGASALAITDFIAGCIMPHWCKGKKTIT